MSNFMEVTFKNGETYRVPRNQIADNRATEYHDRGTAEWDELFFQTMDDDAAAIDWARNNMNWSEDLEPFALRIDEPEEFDYDEEWPNCKIMCADD